jgi:hypothetical protein
MGSSVGYWRQTVYTFLVERVKASESNAQPGRGSRSVSSTMLIATARAQACDVSIFLQDFYEIGDMVRFDLANPVGREA